ncbi:MAG: shikimate dehydrogenase [Sulfitobacter sp.]|jgi:shikimate dehydrogenase
MSVSTLELDKIAVPEDGRRQVRVGLIGKGISLSRTPAMHVAEGTALGLSYTYDLIDPDRIKAGPPPLAEILDILESAGFAGCNVTFPFKKDAMAFLDSLSDPARKVGAVNTIVFNNGRREGHNTDYWGFGEGLRRGLPEAIMDTVLLLGAGGAGGAVAHALKDAGVRNLLILDRSPEAATALADAVGARAVSDPEAAAVLADGIVNTTPMGMAKLPGTAIDTALLEPRHWVSDIVYFPRETALLRAARKIGCRCLDGSGMAVFQAVRAFRFFTGINPDPARMRATFESFSTDN